MWGASPDGAHPGLHSKLHCHWMPPLGECLHHIATAAAMVVDFGRKHKILTKKLFLAS